jgi:PEGA domain
MKTFTIPVVILFCLLAAGTPVAAQIPVTVPITGPPVISTLPGGETGYFSINSIPSGGDVYFDGVFVGEAPVPVPVSTTGNPQHTIKVTLPGYQTWENVYNGNPGAGQTITITATLIPSTNSGQIQVTSYPSGATAVLDRSQSRITPATFSNVPVGNHEISVYLSGYQTYYTSISLSKGQTAVVNVQFTPPVTTGALSISSTPGDAAVYVDGVYQGVTPTVAGNLVAGPHTVILSKAGYQDWVSTVTVTAGQTTPVTATLASDPKPIYGTVSISSDPSGASVYADDVYVGQTSPGIPLVFTQVKPGYHTLLISRPGYQDYTTNGVVTAGQNLDLVIKLTPTPQKPTTGSVSVTSAPSAAEVYLDNAFRGLSPLTLDAVSPGTHGILIKLNGYQDWSSQIQVTAGQTTQIAANLLPAATPTPTQTGAFPVAALGALAAAAVLLTGNKR